MVSRLPGIGNEPVLTYAPGSPERNALAQELKSMSAAPLTLGPVIGAQELHEGPVAEVRAPHRHAQVLAYVHKADGMAVRDAISAALAAQADWAQWPFEERAAVFLKAADLLAGRWRARMNAATMLGQSKNAYQAEIDSACELIDFLRINVEFARRIYADQPLSPAQTWNRIDYRPLEGFVYAVTPFNFTAIGGNLACAPALMGNSVVWKPAATACLSNALVMSVLREAGLPPGVINFVPGDAQTISEAVLSSPHLSGIHFTGSTAVFNGLWGAVAQRIGTYRNYPRLVGETGGKDFVLAHASADVQALAVALVRGAFEYQGQKCSAASRAYIPRSLWPQLKPLLLDMIASIKMGDVAEFDTFMGAVIDARAFA